MAIISKIKSGAHRVRLFAGVFYHSILMRVVLVIFAVTLVMLILQSILPVRVTRSMVFSYKQNTLQVEAESVASALNSYQTLTEENVAEAITALPSMNLDRLVVTDGSGVVLYTSDPNAIRIGVQALFPEIYSALLGNDAFYCYYSESAFESICAIPVMAGDAVLGSIYTAEVDTEQAVLLQSIQRTSVRLAVIVLVIFIIVYLVFGYLIFRKNRRLVDSMRRVHGGDYNHRVEVNEHAKDEFSVLAIEFNALTERLEQTEQNRRQFVSDASHELRTPLAAIRLLSDSILQNDMDMETTRDFIRDISDEADRLTRMTSKLLSLTALDSRQFEQMDDTVVNIGACCRKVSRILSPLAQEGGVHMETSIEEDCYVQAKEDDIVQLIMNLAENGIKYSRGADGLVRIIAYEQNEQIVLIVEDNGVGIPEEELSRIFERFYRVDKARSREAGGTGLGLAIVRETVEKYGGEVSASNRPQGGARFTVTFPRAEWEGEP